MKLDISEFDLDGTKNTVIFDNYLHRKMVKWIGINSLIPTTLV